MYIGRSTYVHRGSAIVAAEEYEDHDEGHEYIL